MKNLLLELVDKERKGEMVDRWVWFIVGVVSIVVL